MSLPQEFNEKSLEELLKILKVAIRSSSGSVKDFKDLIIEKFQEQNDQSISFVSYSPEWSSGTGIEDMKSLLTEVGLFEFYKDHEIFQKVELPNFEYNDILVYQNYDGEERPISLAGMEFDNEKLFVDFNFQGGKSVQFIIGEAEVTVGEDGHSLYANLVLYGHATILGQPLTAKAIESLTPAIGAASLKQLGILSVKSKLSLIALCTSANRNPAVKRIGLQILTAKNSK